MAVGGETFATCNKRVGAVVSPENTQGQGQWFEEPGSSVYKCHSLCITHYSKNRRVFVWLTPETAVPNVMGVFLFCVRNH